MCQSSNYMLYFLIRLKCNMEIFSFFGSVRSSMSHNLRLTLVRLELLIFIFLTQVSLRVSLRSHRSVWLYFGASNNSSCFSVSSEENQSKHLSPRILCFPSWDVRWYQGGKLDKHWEYWPLIGQYWSRDLNTGLLLVQPLTAEGRKYFEQTSYIKLLLLIDSYTFFSLFLDKWLLLLVQSTHGIMHILEQI